jgi:hypothetical protein
VAITLRTLRDGDLDALFIWESDFPVSPLNDHEPR